MTDYKPRILVVDIETAPGKSYHWGMFKVNIGINQIVEPGHILCICAKWLGEKEVFTFSKWEHGAEGMLKGICDLIEQSDAVLSKNGIRFDIPWIRTELALYKMAPLPMITHIDLEKVVRYYFRFQSNKLDFIAQYLGEGAKVEHEGFPLWTKVMNGDPKARNRMLKYCAGDIKITERIYHRLKAFIGDHPAIRPLGTLACKTCGSKHSQKRGWRYTACFKIQRHQCSNPKCGAWYSGKRIKVA